LELRGREVTGEDCITRSFITSTVHQISFVKGKGKVVPVLNKAPRQEDVLEEWRYSATHSLTSALDGGEWSASRPGRFTPRERALGTRWIRGFTKYN
jgi:hypothetical protein